MINSYSLPATVENTGSFIKKYINIMMLFFPITAFLLIPVIPGTTITTILAGLMFLLIPLSTFKEEKTKFFIEIGYFFCIVLTLSFCSQLINLVSHLKLNNTIILINKNDFTKTFYRASHITQTLPLIVGFFVYAYVKYFSSDNLIKYIYWGLRLLCIYGIYDFAFYIVTGQSGDFMANRTFGDVENSGSLFQTVSLGGIGLMRLKSYTGEPSMFVFTVFPFWVLTFGLKRDLDKYMLLGCLILTFSTTAYMCIIMFYAYWTLYNRHFQVFYYGCILIVITCLVLQLNVFQHLLDSVYKFVFAGKLGGESASSQQRSSGFINHVSYWASLNPLNQAFGIGFGYVRSKDFFSTIIVNNGFIGFLIFTWFVLRNLWLKIPVPLLSNCYKIGLVLVYTIMMASVPEFSYPSLWIYIALGYVIQHVSEKAEEQHVLQLVPVKPEPDPVLYLNK